MAVQPDREAPLAPEPGALEALAEAGRAAARAPSLGEAVERIAAAAREAAGVDVALIRLVEPGAHTLVTRAVAALPAVLAGELEGVRLPHEALPSREAGLDEAPEIVATTAELVGAGAALTVPVLDGDDPVGCLELYARERVSDGAAAVARLAAAQVGLAVHALGLGGRGDDERDRVVRLAGDALAAGADVANRAAHVLRLALEVSGAEAAVLRDGSAGVLRSEVGQIPPGLGPELERLAEQEGGDGVAELDGRPVLTLRLGAPSFGRLQLVFPPRRPPSREEIDRLSRFAVRAAHALRAGERTLRLAEELDHARALLGVVGQANAQLSLTHALETTIARVSELVGAERLAVYLLEEGALTTAAERGLAGPHLGVAERLLELALGPFRGRGIVAVADAGSEPALESVGDALAETGIGAAVAIPLVADGEVTGLLAVYPAVGEEPSANEVALLTALAGRVAVAVENARLHERATRLGRELEEALASERGAARRLGALYEISRSFAQSLSLEVTLQTVARTAVELLGVDAAVLRMPDARREVLLPVAMYVNDEQLVEPIRAMLFRPQPAVGPALRRLFRLGEPLLLGPENAEDVIGPRGVLTPFIEKGATAAVVPIATPAEVLASLTLLSLTPSRPVTEETIETALAIGGQAALAIDNARLYQQQKDFADAMTRSLLPQVRPAVAGLDIGEVYASSAHVEVGGDLYDYIALEGGRLAAVLGDVTGHGIDAAADMAMAKYIFRSLAREHPDPGDFLAAANEVVVDEIAPGKFITMLYLLIDPATGSITCASAGHPPPRLIAADGTVTGIEAKGLALGVDAGMEYEPVRAQLESGGAVVLYTDGVIEARRAGELYGVDRLDALLSRRHALRAEDVAASVIQAARRFTGGELLDDCAVVVFKRTS